MSTCHLKVLPLSAALAFAATLVLAQDPVVVAPDVYKVLLENEMVRVMEATFEPGTKVPMHAHRTVITYHLAPSTEKHTFSDGRLLVHDYSGGEVAFSRPFYHSIENVGTSVDRLLEIELKEEPVGVTPAELSDLDPKILAPDDYKVRLENARVRVLELFIRPGGMIPLHMHPETVIYHMGPSHERHTFGEGESTEHVYEGGEVTFFGPYARSAMNIGSNRLHVLSVEVKK